MSNKQPFNSQTIKQPVHTRRNVEPLGDVPGGVLKLTGDFVWEHKEEILNLIRNESGKVLATNPLERIVSLESSDGGIEITTTNEKLAQRIGKALHKAYSGTVEYQWSGDSKLARVLWHREL